MLNDYIKMDCIFIYFRCRAGQLSTAKIMIEEVINIETYFLGKRNEELADLLQLSAEIHSEVIRLIL